MSGEVATEAERMRQYGVIIGADGNLRISIGDGDRIWGDHLRIEFMREDKPGRWRFTHIDVDAAEALAAELIRRANYLRGR